MAFDATSLARYTRFFDIGGLHDNFRNRCDDWTFGGYYCSDLQWYSDSVDEDFAEQVFSNAVFNMKSRLFIMSSRVKVMALP